ncbi:chaplin [Streptomyces sp. 8N706]|uniref:chaplin n=1 Tax=Streptomyces sp. 8N706 TaxID=3457416 RepID=UPI003FD08B99
MRQVARKSLITVAAASGVLAVTGGYAHADANAEGSARNSPGVASGNTIQAPVHIPINVCGNTITAVGLLNPAVGNRCTNGSDGGSGSNGSGGVRGDAIGSPGLGSGNAVQTPVHTPVNACGITGSGGGFLNPALGSKCVNGSQGSPEQPEEPEEPGEPGEPGEPENPGNPENPDNPGNPDTPDNPGNGGSSEEPGEVEGSSGRRNTPPAAQPQVEGQLAQTGAETLGVVLPAAAAMLLGGTVLYRRAKVASRP